MNTTLLKILALALFMNPFNAFPELDSSLVSPEPPEVLNEGSMTDTAASEISEKDSTIPVQADSGSTVQPLHTPPETDLSTVNKEKRRKINLTRRTFNHRRQILLAVGMMAFVALIMTTDQSWNPK